jgi:RND superfamily putative drug exporter
VVTLNEAELGAKSSEAEKVEFQADVATRLMALDNVDAVIFGGESADERTLLFQVLPTTGPTSVETENLVQAIRAQDAVFESELDADLQVTGLSAANIDISQRLADSLPLYLSTVLILSLLLLMVVFRSIAVPLVASVGFLLSVFAALGSVTAVFQWGWLGAIFDVHDPGPILAFLPTLVIGILFGLAMDYQLFLVSGMREAYVHGKNAKDSVNYGIHLSRQVVVAAAIIMISVFGSFAFSEQVMLRAVGFGLAIGVLLDAFLVRLLFVPAVMSLLGDRAWWLPRWLDRIMPNVDVEGEKLERTVAH